MRHFEIGKIVNTQGLSGEVRVFPTTDDPSRFELLNDVTVSWRNKSETLTIERVRYHKQFVILKFKGLDDIHNAEQYKGWLVTIPETEALPLGEDEYYLRDLIGLSVATEKGAALGTLTDVLVTGANDVYAVTDGNGKTVLIPAIKQCVKRVDVSGGVMTVKLMPGLLD